MRIESLKSLTEISPQKLIGIASRQLLVKFEDELAASSDFQRIFPTHRTDEYLCFMDAVSYGDRCVVLRTAYVFVSDILSQAARSVRKICNFLRHWTIGVQKRALMSDNAQYIIYNISK